MVGLATQALVVLMVRTRKVPFIQSRPSLPVFSSIMAAVVLGMIIVLSPFREQFEFVQLPASYWIWFVGIVAAYMAAVQFAKFLYIKIAKEWI